MDYENAYILKDKGIAVELDSIKHVVYLYYLVNNRIYNQDKKILQTIKVDTLKEINEYFKINIEEYGVKVSLKNSKKISQENIDGIKNKKSDGFLYLVFSLGSILSILYHIYQLINGYGLSNHNVGYIILSTMLLIPSIGVYLFIKGGESVNEKNLKRNYELNITSKPFPDMEDKIQKLEDKIDAV